MSITADRIDIHDPIAALCDRLGLQPEDVGEIVFRPDTVTATVYLNNENGKKYLLTDENGRTKVASATLSFKVTT